MKRNPIFSRGRTALAGRFFGMVLLALLLVQLPARADGPDDDYLAISAMIDQGDALAADGKAAAAHDKYVQAREALAAFRRDNPDWNPQTVNLRLRQLGEKAAGTTSTVTVDSGGPKLVPVASSSPVKVLSNGSEPRQVLKLHPQAGDSQEIVFTMKMGMAMSMADKPMPATTLPPMNFTTEMKVKDVSPTGEITYEMTVADFDMTTADSSLPPAALEAMKGVFAKMKGMSGTGRISAGGVVRNFELKLPPGADPQFTQMLGQMKDSFKNSFQPLPDEPVGPGARWEYSTKVKSQGMAITQVITAELVSIEGDRATLNMTLRQDAGSQKITNPSMPSLSVDLTKLSGTGTGKTVVDLTKLAPVSGEINESMDMTMGMTVGQKPSSMEMKMTMDMSYTAN